MYLTEKTDNEKRCHPHYRLTELRGSELKLALNRLSREEMIEWLCWNDRNGVYSDEDSLQEFGNVLMRDEAAEIIISQILEGQADER